MARSMPNSNTSWPLRCTSTYYLEKWPGADRRGNSSPGQWLKARRPYEPDKRKARKEVSHEPKFVLIATALLLMSNIAIAQEQNEPSAGAQEHPAPTAKMTGEDMMSHIGQCKNMGRGMRRGMMGHGMPMRMIFILMDNDGDGALSLEEFQTAHEKIFKGIDGDKDGKVTPTEMQMFFSGGSATS
jgi:hypothetical protein